MTEIRIDNTGSGTDYLYTESAMWRDYIDCENFDEEVVLTENRDYNNFTEASWYQRTKEVLDDIDAWDEYPEDLSDEANAKLKELYENCRCTEDIFVDVLRVLYPKDTFTAGTIRGVCQREWQNYIIKGDVDVKLLEAFYFNRVSCVTIITDTESFSDVITDDALWKASQSGLEEYFRKEYDIPADEKLHIYLADGYIQTINWRKVC